MIPKLISLFLLWWFICMYILTKRQSMIHRYRLDAIEIIGKFFRENDIDSGISEFFKRYPSHFKMIFSFKKKKFDDFFPNLNQDLNKHKFTQGMLKYAKLQKN